MAVFRWVSRITLVVSTALGVWRLWKKWQDRKPSTAEAELGNQPV